MQPTLIQHCGMRPDCTQLCSNKSRAAEYNGSKTKLITVTSEAGARSVSRGGGCYISQRQDPLGRLTDTLIFFSVKSSEVAEGQSTADKLPVTS